MAKRKAKKETKPLNPKRVPKPFGRTPSEHAFSLADIFLFAHCIDTGNTSTLENERIEEFKSMVNTGELFNCARNIAAVCIHHKVEVPDSVIDGILYTLPKVQSKKTLTDDDRNTLLKCHAEMNRSYFREWALESAIESGVMVSLEIVGRWGMVNEHGGGAPPSDAKGKAEEEYKRLIDDPETASLKGISLAKRIVQKVMKKNGKPYSLKSMQGYITKWKDKYPAKSRSADK